MNDTLIERIAPNPSPTAVYSTNSCASCWSETGPFVSGMTPSKFPIYLCKTCITTAALASGWTTPFESTESAVLIEGQQARIRMLEAELEQERLSKTVPLAEVVDFFEKRAQLRPEEPVPVTQPAA